VRQLTFHKSRVNFPCAIAVRFRNEYYAKIRAKSEKLFVDFWKFTEWRKVTAPNLPDDIEKFCRLHGIVSSHLLKKVREETDSFTMATEIIKKHNNYRPPSQLNLFSDNLVRS
jgi:hypothetical protein